MRGLTRTSTEHIFHQGLRGGQLAAWALVILTWPVVLPASASDVQPGCCNGLEERIAELEAIAARSERRTTSLKVSGSISRALLFWDDGANRDVAVVTNDNDNSVATFEGETKDMPGGWSAGFVLDLDILSAGSSDVSQTNVDGVTAIELGDASIWVKNEHFGQITIGQTSAKGASSGASERDLSRTETVAYSGVADVGGGMRLRRAGISGSAGLLDLKWGDVIDSLDEPDGNIVVYDSPEIAGISVSALWGEDDIWNIGLGYDGHIPGTFEIAAGMAYNENLQGNLEDVPDVRTLSGSVSVLHTPTGLNLTYATGVREHISAFTLNDGRTIKPDGPSFHYVKAGLIAALTPLGNTAFYAEYGRFRDVLGSYADTATVEGLTGSSAGSACATARAACTVAGSTATVFGAGVVQHLSSDDEDGRSATHTQLYLGYRHFEADADLATKTGASARAAPLGGLDTLMTGVLIEF